MPDPGEIPADPLEGTPPPKPKIVPDAEIPVTATKPPMEGKKTDPGRAESEEETATPLKVKAVKGEAPIPDKPIVKEVKSQIPVTDKNDKEARTLFLAIPPPRGQIVDRNGQPLAQCRMAYFLGIEFKLPATATESEILRYVRQRVPFIQKQLPDGWDLKDERILEHAKNRRWMPLLASRPVPAEATEELRKNLPQGVVAVPCYLRHYPHGTVAAHLLGEMGRSGKMATGAIQSGDPIWPLCIGKSGLESRFEDVLAGTPGRINLVFGAGSEKLSEEMVEHPKPGKTVVTTIDLEMQTTVERVLRSRTRRGAMVIMDVATGDILAMASNPTYDPNLFAFGIRDADYQPLLQDPDVPLLCRAFGAAYQPASTFKVITALAALESGKVDGGTYFDCTSSIYIGDRYFHNWSKNSEGPMNVVDAIKRSCNTWFYRAALLAGATPVTSMATRFGLGQKTELCLSELSGRVPTPEWWKKTYGYNMSQGDLANIAIGQGQTLVTPLQDCAMMAGIARGHSVPRSRLVQQIQELDGTISEFFPPEKRSELAIQPEHLRLVRAGMKAVVEEGDGTGKAAGNKFVKVAGKTGTAQWKKNKKTGDWIHMAWFAGYLPADNPQYAFAAVYEGDPGEDSISGGRKVAPLVGDVFDDIYDRKKHRGESLTGPARPADDTGEDKRETVRKAKPAVPAAPAPEPAQEPAVEPAPREGGLRGLWKKLFKR